MLHVFILHLAGPQPARGLLGQCGNGHSLWMGAEPRTLLESPSVSQFGGLDATSQAQAVTAGLGGQAQADGVIVGQLLSQRGLHGGRRKWREEGACWCPWLCRESWRMLWEDLFGENLRGT